jgi:hypothetical protein
LENADSISRGIIATMGLAISMGGLYGLMTLLQNYLRRIELGGYKKRMSNWNEHKTLLTAYNLAKGRIDTRIPKLENLKIKFETYCPHYPTNKGITNFEITTATYIIDAEPKNHLSSSILFTGINLDTNEEQIIILKSSGSDVVFQSLDDNATKNFGCPTNMVNLFNKKLYQYCVKDLKLDIVDFPIHYKSNVKTDF